MRGNQIELSSMCRQPTRPVNDPVEKQNPDTNCETAELELARECEHEQRGKNVSRENNQVVLHGAQQPIGAERKQQ
ncbi:MAG: hypothetical protein ACJ746_21085 [Bryobacteraceae bacterium]